MVVLVLFARDDPMAARVSVELLVYEFDYLRDYWYDYL